MEKTFLFVFFAIAAIFDHRQKRIPNLLCLAGGASGLLFWLERSGEGGLGDSLSGLILMLGILLPFWLLQVLGGGDVKLMMAAGCWLGREIWTLLVYSGLCCAIYGAGLMIIRGNFLKRAGVLASYVRRCLAGGTGVSYPFDREDEEDVREGGIHVSYGVFAGFVLGFMLPTF